MKDRIIEILEYITPVSKRKHKRTMIETIIVINGMKKELTQQAELLAGMIQKFADDTDKKPTKKSKLKDDIAFR